MQRVERVEELFFGAVLAGQELDVVDEQHVDGSVFVPELAHASRGYGGDDLVGELLRREVNNALAREAVVDLVADCMHEVRLAQTDSSIEEQGVVAVAGSFRDGLGRRVSEL